jgi:hypothetical protein
MFLKRSWFEALLILRGLRGKCKSRLCVFFGRKSTRSLNKMEKMGRMFLLVKYLGK